MKILICSAFIVENPGDAAFLEITLKSLLSTFRHNDLTVMCNNPLKIKERFAIKTVKYPNKKKPYETIKEIINCDAIVFGPGGIIEDATGISVFGGNIPNIFWTAFLGCLLRKKIIFYAVGIGPVSSAYGRFLARLIFKAADLITVRDKGSKKYLTSLVRLNKKIHEISDPAVMLNPGKRIKDKQMPGNIKIGVSLRPWLEGNSAKNNYIIDALSGSFDYLIKNHNAEIVFMPFHYEYDLPVALEIRNRMCLKNNTKITEKFEKIEDILNIIDELDILIGMRLHSLIFAAAVSGKPVMALEYDAKVRYFMESIGQGERSVNIENLSFPLFKEKADGLMLNIKSITGQINEARLKLRYKAENGQALLKDYLKCRG